MKKAILLVFLNFLFFTGCKEQSPPIVQAIEVPPKDKKLQDSIIEAQMLNVQKHGLYTIERQEALDKALEQDSTIAYFWQQKAMPLFKQGKYEVGMEYIDKAVQYDRQDYQEYRAFIKCIFAKTYRAAIEDFKDCKARFGNNYVMDHSYDFHIALSYLQLNEFEKAEQIFKQDIESVRQDKGDDWVHHLDLFYYGVALYEQKKYKAAIPVFDEALSKYSQFTEALYHKALCFARLDDMEQANTIYKEVEKYGNQGYTITEDNVIYVHYPYQLRW